MLNINRVTLLGHAGRDPDIRTLPDGGRAATFSLATTERWKRDDGGTAERTAWHRIAVYGPAVEPVEAMVRKGAAVLVEGRLAHREFRDRQGRDRAIAEIVVAGPHGMVNVLTRKPPDEPDAAEAPAAEPPKTESPKADGDDPDKGGADDGGDTCAADTCAGDPRAGDTCAREAAPVASDASAPEAGK
ncbi:MAG: single-stranded DNA-binding protein [Rhodospirillales bacterium]|nr:single-stranded DNA-binding protein [Rhodospirillales bacterium]